MLESGHGPVPSLAEAVAGESIRSNWWGHPRGRDIFRATRAVRDSPDILVCRLIAGKITYIHRRHWPALVRIADALGSKRLAAIHEVHTASGAHKVVTTAFPQWVPEAVRLAAQKLSETEARESLGAWLSKVLRRTSM